MALRTVLALALALGWTAASAETPGPGMGLGYSVVADVLGPELAGLCHADLADLGVSPEVQKSLADKRFELKKRAVREVGDLIVARMELSRLLEAKQVDLDAAKKLVEQASQKEAELRKLHLEFVAALRASLTDEQWQRLRGVATHHQRRPCPECRGSGMGPDAPDEGCPCPKCEAKRSRRGAMGREMREDVREDVREGMRERRR